jgi:hypothetical protein
MPPKEGAALKVILDSFTGSSDILRQRYGNDLKMSLRALENSHHKSEHLVTSTTLQITCNGILEVEALLKDQRDRI